MPKVVVKVKVLFYHNALSALKRSSTQKRNLRFSDPPGFTFDTFRGGGFEQIPKMLPELSPKIKSLILLAPLSPILIQRCACVEQRCSSFPSLTGGLAAEGAIGLCCCQSKHVSREEGQGWAALCVYQTHTAWLEIQPTCP